MIDTNYMIPLFYVERGALCKNILESSFKFSCDSSAAVDGAFSPPQSALTHPQQHNQILTVMLCGCLKIMDDARAWKTEIPLQR
jgi:hypothetical protein